MNRNTFWGTFAMVLLLGLAALASKKEASSITSVHQLSTTSKLIVIKPEAKLNQLVNANNRFGFNLFTRLQLQQKSQPENIFISPQSIAIALAMTRNGTVGKTQAQITQTLGLEQLDTATVDHSYQQLIKTLTTTDNSVELAIANSLWVNQNISLKAPFVKTAQDFYQGKVTNLDFTNPSTKKTIDRWVANNTAHQIPEIVDSISPEDALYLINAIYFKGSWTNKFAPDATNLSILNLRQQNL
jgi:serine protease inhibitor